MTVDKIVVIFTALTMVAFRLECLMVIFVENAMRFFIGVIKKFDIKSMTVGVIVYQVEDKFSDYILYPAVIIWLGPFLGGMVMLGVSMLINLFYLWLYDRIKKDWLGMEALKEAQAELAMSSQFVTWILSKGYWPTLALLSWKFSPFITTAYMRAGVRKYNGMSQEDWRTFWLSMLFGNIFWILVVYTGISIAVNINPSTFEEIVLAGLFLVNAFLEGRKI
jgi:hypothetical protein